MGYATIDISFSLLMSYADLCKIDARFFLKCIYSTITPKVLLYDPNADRKTAVFCLSSEKVFPRFTFPFAEVISS